MNKCLGEECRIITNLGAAHFGGHASFAVFRCIDDKSRRTKRLHLYRRPPQSIHFQRTSMATEQVGVQISQLIVVSVNLIVFLGEESEPYKLKTTIVTRNWKYSRVGLGGD